MATGSGLDAQLGFAQESVVGTGVTVTKFAEFNSESLSLDVGYLEPAGLRVGRYHKRASRVKQSRRSVSGDIEFEVATRGLGMLFKHMLGSNATATQIGSTTAYRQIHTPQGKVGKSLTIQVGRPEPGSGLVKPFTYRGCKITSWELKLTDNGIMTLNVSVNGWDETTATALAAASYTANAGVWSFPQATFKIGGTPSTSSGLLSVAGGTAVATVVKEISIKCEYPMATERYGIGNAGIKREPLENSWPTITGSLSAEFSQAELYDVYTAGDYTPIELSLVGDEIGESGENDTFSVIMPAVILKSAAPTVSGPDIVQMTTGYEAYDNEVDAPIQLMTISADTAL
uniref:phage tail tube protein n=1 Tax=Herbidospora sakaeratensis TaxID=564415 RepID=UPI000781B658|nr:phage tail tube protein [Herbidospora sakaeratensis]